MNYNPTIHEYAMSCSKVIQGYTCDQFSSILIICINTNTRTAMARIVITTELLPRAIFYTYEYIKGIEKSSRLDDILLQEVGIYGKGASLR